MKGCHIRNTHGKYQSPCYYYPLKVICYDYKLFDMTINLEFLYEQSIIDTNNK